MHKVILALVRYNKLGNGQTLLNYKRCTWSFSLVLNVFLCQYVNQAVTSISEIKFIYHADIFFKKLLLIVNSAYNLTQVSCFCKS